MAHVGHRADNAPKTSLAHSLCQVCLFVQEPPEEAYRTCPPPLPAIAWTRPATHALSLSLGRMPQFKIPGSARPQTGASRCQGSQAAGGRRPWLCEGTTCTRARGRGGGCDQAHPRSPSTCPQTHSLGRSAGQARRTIMRTRSACKVWSALVLYRARALESNQPRQRLRPCLQRSLCCT